MGCMYSSNSFNANIEVLKQSGATIISTQQIDLCKHVYAAHILYKKTYFQFTYLNGVLKMCHRDCGRSKFPTIALMLLWMDKIADGFVQCSNERTAVTANIWKGPEPGTLEIRFNMNACPVYDYDYVWTALKKPLLTCGYVLSPMTDKLQAIVHIPEKKLNAVKLGFLTSFPNPVYTWQDYSR